MSEWKKTTLGEVCEVGDGAHTKVERQKFGVPYLTSKNFAKGTLKLDEVDFISEEDYERLFPKKSKAITRLQEDDVLMGIIGTFGNAYKYKSDDYFGISSSIAILRPDKSKIDPDFLEYTINSNKFERIHRAYSSGSVQGYSNIATIKSMPIVIPSLQSQRTIVSILRILDNKIDNLRRQNETLEKIAQTLFKHWFIDFEFPNDDGKPYKSSGGAMVASELGDIPEGWHVACLDEYVNVINGYSYKGTELLESDTALINLKNFDRNGGFKVDGFKSLKTDNYKKQHIVCPNDLIVAHTDLTQNAEVLGNAALVQPSDKYKKYILSMDLVKLESKKDFLNNFFFYYLLSTREFKGHCIGYSNGTTVLHLSKKAIPEYIFPVSNEIDIIIKFQNIASILRNKITNNIQQIQTLIKTRDALLPKLMSGQIRVKEGESLIEKVK